MSGFSFEQGKLFEFCKTCIWISRSSFHCVLLSCAIEAYDANHVRPQEEFLESRTPCHIAILVARHIILCYLAAQLYPTEPMRFHYE